MPTAAEVVKPKAERLERWARIDRIVKSFRRRASDLAKEQAAIEEDELLPYVKKHGGKARCVLISGYRLLIEDKRENVKWKELYVDEHGDEAANQIIDDQPTHEELKVTPPKPAKTQAGKPAARTAAKA